MSELAIIFEDDDLVAVNKPAGLLVIPDRYRKDIPNLRDMLAKRNGQIFVVHRLDKETSGILIFAKNADAHRLLNDQFTNHTIEKVYIALVRGRLRHGAGSIKYPLAPHPKKPAVMTVSQSGKISVTDYNIREAFRDYTLVEARPRTGRLHQVRVHLAAFGYPLAIDKLYGSKEPIFLSSIKPDYKPSGDGESPLIDRLTLHAEKITFVHPREPDQPRTLTAPLPKDFEAVVQQLQKYNK
jgi:23S rRNA pseudouridine1911/1915/1917 synthase